MDATPLPRHNSANHLREDLGLCGLAVQQVLAAISASRIERAVAAGDEIRE
jgi:hypothetical protein